MGGDCRHAHAAPCLPGCLPAIHMLYCTIPPPCRAINTPFLDKVLNTKEKARGCLRPAAPPPPPLHVSLCAARGAAPVGLPLPCSLFTRKYVPHRGPSGCCSAGGLHLGPHPRRWGRQPGSQAVLAPQPLGAWLHGRVPGLLLLVPNQGARRHAAHTPAAVLRMQPLLGRPAGRGRGCGGACHLPGVSCV